MLEMMEMLFMNGLFEAEAISLMTFPVEMLDWYIPLQRAWINSSLQHHALALHLMALQKLHHNALLVYREHPPATQGLKWDRGLLEQALCMLEPLRKVVDRALESEAVLAAHNGFADRKPIPLLASSLN